MLLGHDRTRSAQVVKQPDVLMLHYLVPDEVAAGSLQPNLDFYEPRTALASTLSPGIHAALLARAGRLAEATETLRLTARIDLDDIGGTTARGLHLAAMGSVWRSLAFGFAGLRPVGDALAIDPVLPPGWEHSSFACAFATVAFASACNRAVSKRARIRPCPRSPQRGSAYGWVAPRRSSTSQRRLRRSISEPCSRACEGSRSGWCGATVRLAPVHLVW